MRMLTARLTVGAVALSVFVAWKGGSDQLKLASDSRLWVDGTSTVRDFRCRATALDAAIESANGATEAVLAGDKAVGSVTFSVPVGRLDCGNGTMNAHMLKSLKAREHPVISFRLDSYELSRSAEQTTGALTGALSIGGVERPVVLPVVLQNAGDGALRVLGTHDLNMRDFNLVPPSLMLGTLKVRERVKVGFDLLLKS